MPRFFIPPEKIRNRRFVLSGSEARHAIVVLRTQVGDCIDLFDGKDASYRGHVEAVFPPDRLEGQVVEVTTRSPMTPSRCLILGQALLKGPKWDWLIEKATEIGVTRIQPLLTERTVVHWHGETGHAKMERWRRIAMSASKQCGRTQVMAVDSPVTLTAVLRALPSSTLTLIPWEKEKLTTVRMACEGFQGQDVTILIGPEGGWEQREIDLASRSGAVPVKLGPTLLRSETAGLIASVLALRELGVY